MMYEVSPSQKRPLTDYPLLLFLCSDIHLFELSKNTFTEIVVEKAKILGKVLGQSMPLYELCYLKLFGSDIKQFK